MLRRYEDHANIATYTVKAFVMLELRKTLSSFNPGTLSHMLRNPNSVYAWDYDIDVALASLSFPGDNRQELVWRSSLFPQFCAKTLAKMGYECWERTGFTEVSNPNGVGVGVDFFFMTASASPGAHDLGKAVLFGEEVHWMEHQRVELFSEYISSVRILNWVHQFYCSQSWEVGPAPAGRGGVPPRRRKKRGTNNVVGAPRQAVPVLRRRIPHPACLPLCDGGNVGCDMKDDWWHTEDEFEPEDFAAKAAALSNPESRNSSTVRVVLEFEKVPKDALALADAATQGVVGGASLSGVEDFLYVPRTASRLQTDGAAGALTDRLLGLFSALQITAEQNTWVNETARKLEVGGKILARQNGSSADAVNVSEAVGIDEAILKQMHPEDFLVPGVRNVTGLDFARLPGTTARNLTSLSDGQSLSDRLVANGNLGGAGNLPAPENLLGGTCATPATAPPFSRYAAYLRPTAPLPSPWKESEAKVRDMRWSVRLSDHSRGWMNGVPTPLLEHWSLDCWSEGLWVSFERCCDMEVAPYDTGVYQRRSDGGGFNSACATFFGNYNIFERCCLSELILIERKMPIWQSYMERVKTIREDRRWLSKVL